MSGRQEHVPGRRVRARWLVGVAALLTAGLTTIALAPAGASTTVNAQLSLSGVASKDNVLGGSQIGVHPGDTVDFKASALPTAGLENVPSLGSLLGGVLGSITGSSFQVKVTFAANVPSVGGRTLTLGGPTTGSCAGKAQQPVRFPAKGTFSFTWTVATIATGLLGCSANGLSDTSLNQLQAAGVKLNAANQYVGRIVVADNPPKGGISIQLPSVHVAPSVPIVGQLPTISVPGINLPTIHASVPNLLPGKSGGGSKATAPTAPPAKGSDYTPPALTVPEMVVPKGYGDGVYVGNGGFFNGTLPGSSSSGQAQTGGASPALAGSAPSATRTAGAPADTSVTPKTKTVDLASRTSSPSSQLPVILAIIAIIALALVAGTYARLFLMRKP